MVAALNITKHADDVLTEPRTSAPRRQRNKNDPTFVPPKGCASRRRLYIEAPGEDELAQCKPFVGRAGQMLGKPKGLEAQQGCDLHGGTG